MITSMVSKESLKKIKEEVENYLGQKVCVKCSVGKNKYDYIEGVITETYPDIFNVVDEGSKLNFRHSYSYSELLTNNLELTLPNGEIIANDDYSVECAFRI